VKEKVLVMFQKNTFFGNNYIDIIIMQTSKGLIPMVGLKRKILILLHNILL